ncbi:hypothetical protein M1N04_00610 [Peptococcaceae bacterium]|nr:hypothetical protein [Peptococcaceae bacterium]
MDEVEMIKFLGIMVVVAVISMIVAIIGGHLGIKKGISIVCQSSWPSWLEKRDSRGWRILFATPVLLPDDKKKRRVKVISYGSQFVMGCMLAVVVVVCVEVTGRVWLWLEPLIGTTVTNLLSSLLPYTLDIAIMPAYEFFGIIVMSFVMWSVLFVGNYISSMVNIIFLDWIIDKEMI